MGIFSKLMASIFGSDETQEIAVRKREKRLLDEKLFPEIKNGYPYMIQKKQNVRRFKPQARGMKQFLQNPNPETKDLNKLKSNKGV